MKWVNNIVSTILMILLISVASIVMISKFSGGEPQAFGYQLKTVLSGSMEPGIKTGSIIAVKPNVEKDKFKKGDVITFQEEDGTLITHRISEVVKTPETVLYRTKGDNNNTEDMNPVLPANVVAEYTGFTIPYVGYFVSFSQSKNGAFLLLIPGLLLLLYSGYTIWKALSELEIAQKKQVDLLAKEGENSSS
ncbi:signal peptidase I [Virgibacillus sp. 179-BFC.A HS]|uniref:Signal peptidase I n=1 Tax=Tigheibacillus jepli TaxID=3035914 RepID=A0ABU5CFP0_9BACI|nr:signal peptidase I [Virgibacillus sp. 179-BFC.A HS]MDY0404816.1 signal peptidase I [Virgibacillus sp. 179-BFC.A HS]